MWNSTKQLSGVLTVTGGIYLKADCRFSQERQQKTLSVADKQHSDCDNLCDADSVPEVIIMFLESKKGSL